MTTLEISDLGVHLGSREVLHKLDLTIPSGSFAALLGPSGCGKTTLLRTIAGLVRPSSGAIRFGKQLVSVSSLVLPPHKRNIGYLPQEGGLFPHLSIAENVGFALSRNLKRAERASVIEEMLDLVGLSGYGARKPHQLSGGQQTRVALARALAMKPSIVLLDEPFSNLDEALRAEVSGEVVALLKRSKTTSLMVTHDREDALVSADLIALMRGGQVVQTGAPSEVYLKPKSADIAESTGDILTLAAVRTNSGEIASALNGLPNSIGERGELLIRPEEIRIHPVAGVGTKATIAKINYYGHDAVLELDLPGVERLIPVRVAGPLQHSVGQTITVEHFGPIRWVSKEATRE